MWVNSTLQINKYVHYQHLNKTKYTKVRKNKYWLYMEYFVTHKWKNKQTKTSVFWQIFGSRSIWKPFAFLYMFSLSLWFCTGIIAVQRIFLFELVLPKTAYTISVLWISDSTYQNLLHILQHVRGTAHLNKNGNLYCTESTSVLKICKTRQGNINDITDIVAWLIAS